MHKSSPPKNVSPNITNTLLRPFRNWSSPHSLLLSPCQPQTHLGFPYLNFPKPVLAPQPHHSISDKAASRTYAHKPLQRLFRPYPKLTPYPHPYPHLCLRNPYYTIKLTFNMSTNPMLCRQHKPTFRHRYNQLRHRTTFINIPRWIPYKSCRLSTPSSKVSPPLLTMLTGSYKTLLLSTFLLQFCVLSHICSTQQRTMARRQLMLDDF